MAFKKVIALPVDLVSTAATTIASPFQRSNTVKSADTSESANNASDSPQTTPPSTPKIVTKEVNASGNPAVNSPKSPVGSLDSRQSSRQSLKSPDVKSVELGFAMHELDKLQDLLSLETVLQLIHVNKDSEHRVEQFINIRFPGRIRNDV